MQRATSTLFGFLVIAVAATTATQADDRVGQERERESPTIYGSDRKPGQDGKRKLRPVTSGMRPLEASAAQIPAGEMLAQAATKPIAAENSKNMMRPHTIIIDALVAYTKKAASHYLGIEQEVVELAIETTNESFRRSNLGHIKLRLVHTYQTDYIEEGAHFDHLWRFADKGDGYMEEVHALREAYRADVVLLVVDDAKGCGLATRVSADAEDAFAVVHHECAVANYSVAHEIGHLIGARHELGFTHDGRWRDIMSYKESCGGCPRLPVWSSPRVLVNGEPAGTVELDNARIIAEHAARVAAFR